MRTSASLFNPPISRTFGHMMILNDNEVLKELKEWNILWSLISFVKYKLENNRIQVGTDGLSITHFDG